MARCSTYTPDGLRCCLRLVSRTESGCIDSHAASVAVLQPIPSHGAKLLSPAAVSKSGLGANGHLEYFFADVVEVGAVDHYQYTAAMASSYIKFRSCTPKLCSSAQGALMVI